MARRLTLVTASVLPFLSFSTALSLDTTNPVTITQAATSIANSLMTTYHNPNSTAGDFNQPQPWFWWLSGSGWTALLDYTVYTADTTHKPALLAALAENLGPNLDFAPAEQASWEANDDQAYWLYGALTALEYGFDEPTPGVWLAAANNVFSKFVARWAADAATCGGGLKWQFDPAANGFFYKNSVTNGGFFQTAARLARYSAAAAGGNTTYADWARTVWDWSTGAGFVAADYSVYDGASDEGTDNCTTINGIQWSYNVATYLHGAANMYAYTGAVGLVDEQAVWATRVQGLVDAANRTFFSPPDGSAPGVMYEQFCEPTASCTIDQTSFKSSLSRWLGKTAILVPGVKDQIMSLLATSAGRAAGSCTDAASGAVSCGMKWWAPEGFDGYTDFGSMLSALEVVQSLLVGNAPALATLTPAA